MAKYTEEEIKKFATECARINTEKWNSKNTGVKRRKIYKFSSLFYFVLLYKPLK